LPELKLSDSTGFSGKSGGIWMVDLLSNSKLKGPSSLIQGILLQHNKDKPLLSISFHQFQYPVSLIPCKKGRGAKMSISNISEMDIFMVLLFMA